MDKRIIEQLAQISKDFHNAQQEIMTQHPDINPSNDARLTVFTNCYIVIDSIYICSIVSSYELSEPGWWNKLILENKISGKPTDQALRIFVRGFDSFTITAYFTLLFIAIENSFRAFHKAVMK
jgi:hypothetical protein